MAPTMQTQPDSNLKPPGIDQLNGFDPLAVLGFTIDDPVPDDRSIDARYRKIARIVGIIHRNDPRLPWTIGEVNRARDNLRSGYRRVVETTRGYHRPIWNLSANEGDLVGLLTPGPSTYVTSSSLGVSLADNLSSGPHSTPIGPAFRPSFLRFPVQPPRAAPTPTTSVSDSGRRQTSGDDECFVAASRSNVSSRKDPISESTKREMRQARDAEKPKSKESKEKSAMHGTCQTQEKPEGGTMQFIEEEDDPLGSLFTEDVPPGYIMVGSDGRVANSGQPVVMRVDRSGRTNFRPLVTTYAMSRVYYTLDCCISYDVVNLSPVVLTRLRNANEIAANDMYPSRNALKVYHKMMMAQKEGDAHSQGS